MRQRLVQELREDVDGISASHSPLLGYSDAITAGSGSARPNFPSADDEPEAASAVSQR